MSKRRVSIPSNSRVISNRSSNGKFCSPRPVLTQVNPKGFFTDISYGDLIQTPWMRGSDPARNKQGYVPKGGSSRKRRVYGSNGNLERVRRHYVRSASANPRFTVKTESGERVNMKEVKENSGPTMGIMPETQNHPNAKRLLMLRRRIAS